MIKYKIKILAHATDLLQENGNVSNGVRFRRDDLLDLNVTY